MPPKEKAKVTEEALAKRESALAERETALNDRETALVEREAALVENETALEERAASMNERESDLDAREQAVAARELTMIDLIDTEEIEETLSESDIALIEAGCEAYDIAPEFVFSSGIDRETGEAVILTNGGKRVRFARGQTDVAPLTQIEITGINPDLKKRKPVAGKEKEAE